MAYATQKPTFLLIPQTCDRTLVVLIYTRRCIQQKLDNLPLGSYSSFEAIKPLYYLCRREIGAGELFI
ncbi:hypothetical protein [Nostoc sp.]|uniref:hypothetical protein n=1 Tax=Nostoc sp. TaxID=1180 RepID=UPI002FF7D7DF